MPETRRIPIIDPDNNSAILNIVESLDVAGKYGIPFVNPDGSKIGPFLKLDQTTPQTTIGRFNFPDIAIDTDLIYTDSATGNVGIGTTSPDATAKLDIEGSDGSAKFLLDAGGDALFILDATTDKATYFMRQNGDNKFNFGYNGSTGFQIYNYGTSNEDFFLESATGNIGIGTTSPTNKLELIGTSNVFYAYGISDGVTAPFIVRSERTGSGGGSVFRLQMGRSDGAGFPNKFGLLKFENETSIEGNFERAGQIAWALSDVTDGSEDGYLDFYTIGGGVVTHAMRIDSSQNVGIGTDSPEQKLDSRGNFVIGDGSSNAIIYFRDPDGLSAHPSISYDTTTRSEETLYINVQSGDDVIFSDGGKSNVNMIIDGSTSYVGIGTTSPQAPLHIVTDATNNAFRIEENSGGEYADVYVDINGDMNWDIPSGILRLGNLIIDPVNNYIAKSATNRPGFHFSGNNNIYVRDSISGNIFVNFDKPTLGVTIGSSATPTGQLTIDGGTGSLSTGITFGDGDTGFYEGVDDRLYFACGNGLVWVMQDSAFYAADSSVRPILYARTPSTSQTSISPNRNDPDVGLGYTSANVGNLLANGDVMDYGKGSVLGDFYIRVDPLALYRGNASNPTIRIGDGDSGFRESSDDVMHWSTGGVDAITVDASQNVILPTDSQNLFFGTGKDMAIYYDGTDGTIDTGVVSPSDLVVDCGTEKTIELAEVVWDDLRVPMQNTRINPIKSEPAFEEFTDGLFLYKFDTSNQDDESLHFVAQMPHSYKEGTDIEPHIHRSPDSTNTGNVVWEFEYVIVNIDGTFASTATTSKITVAADGVARKHQVSDFDTIDGTGLNISHMFICRLTRLSASDSNDTFTGKACVLEFDFHYQKNTIGSRQEYVK